MPDTAIELPEGLRKALAHFRARFGIEFSLWEGATGRLLHRAAGQFSGDELLRAELVRRVADRGAPEIVDDGDVAVLVAVPFQFAARKTAVAMAPLAIQPTRASSGLAALARMMNCGEHEAAEWLAAQELWTPASIVRCAETVVALLNADSKAGKLEREVEKLSKSLSGTYEEICLLYGVTQNLRISASDEELGKLTLDWLEECLPAIGVAIQFLPVAEGRDATYRARTRTQLLAAGDFPFDDARFSAMTQHLDLNSRCGPLVLNDQATSRDEWPFPEVRQLVVVPLAEGDNLYGWIAAVNHEEGAEFGSVEANLLHSVGAIIGIHSGNRELYRQQAEFLASVVRALTSAIDAKDPYTCGHSDRVARVAVRVAREMRCGSGMLNTLYMAGLLHDIGKIGIDDHVLRKPGKLTDTEYEHIKSHPELGYRILADLRQLSDVLPAVLHHHEQWDGRGYPSHLAGDATPLLARITAVADAFDAMTSDRPYRKGLPLERVDEILREGSGRQWDPAVINAYFRCRDDIVAIVRQERANLSLDVERWHE
ncbi:MAG: HD-GYP domain-containing protein [Planctomycetes bacterium]|nr:HD-GYP domain-containing protein [Planctomycetota bacterium]